MRKCKEPSGIDRLFAALQAFEGPDETEVQVAMAGESKSDNMCIQNGWQRQTWEQNGGGFFVTPTGRFHIEKDKNGSIKRMERVDGF